MTLASKIPRCMRHFDSLGSQDNSDYAHDYVHDSHNGYDAKASGYEFTDSSAAIRDITGAIVHCLCTCAC